MSYWLILCAVVVSIMAHVMPDELVAVNQKILPEGLLVQNTGDPPAVPVDYEEGFVLPQHYTKPLQTLLGDDKYSKNLRFFEEDLVTPLRAPFDSRVTRFMYFANKTQ